LPHNDQGKTGPMIGSSRVFMAENVGMVSGGLAIPSHAHGVGGHGQQA
jgi:hypothetical protein